MTKFIFVTGGVVSSLGKGLAASSLAAVLQARGFKVRLRKLDPYLNVDPGTMSPYQHGEVFVTDDGTEADLDLGHYERFTGVSSTHSDSITTGKIYSTVLAKERRGDYLGATVQVVPHIIDEIKSFVTNDITDEDFIICEIGGTVGDIESLPFLETIRQLGNDLGRDNVLYIHVTLLPYIAAAGEIKTKPTQHSVKELLSVGIQPDILLCRSERPIPEEARRKLGLFCNVKAERVIEASDLKSIYEAPLVYHANGLDGEVCKYFKIEAKQPDLTVWTEIVHRIYEPAGMVTIAIVGKYVQLLDAYKSLIQSLIHAGIANNVKANLKWVDSEQADSVSDQLKGAQAILVPGGFGERGVNGKLEAIKFARENKIPYFGICFGMQLAVLETVRNVLGLTEANSTELGQHTPEPVIGLMTEWMDGQTLQKRQLNGDMGGTMRLGAYDCNLDKDSKVAEIYGMTTISERHRHRYEVNPAYIDRIEAAGLKFVGMSPEGDLPEIIELQDHPWFIGVQFHPEFKSRPFSPHPLFVDFVKAALDQFSKKG
ncbi:CTP synthase [Candidatus Odyssella acanthamoebae]|uniref:CTP synthase n=1 Tax=Candidatus Odyssella acanthamoebae TaxID=91604 RepID=A0A077ATX1_9PROT|nr:CTP synthase [Candidatus Paracaedibacter acanthamoebae]AIK95841.1 CTP synthase [Candidatus Paracaedibacter acanthamoebae]